MYSVLMESRELLLVLPSVERLIKKGVWDGCQSLIMIRKRARFGIILSRFTRTTL